MWQGPEGKKSDLQEVGGIWVETEISPACFPLSSLVLCVFVSLPAPPQSVWKLFASGPTGAPPGGPAVGPGSAAEGRGLRKHALPRGQWVSSGSDDSRERASLQHHDGWKRLRCGLILQTLRCCRCCNFTSPEMKTIQTFGSSTSYERRVGTFGPPQRREDAREPAHGQTGGGSSLIGPTPLGEGFK